MNQLSDCGKVVTGNINRLFSGKEPWQISLITATSVYTIIYLWNLYNEDESVTNRIKRMVFSLVKKIPSIKSKIDTEISKINIGFENDIIKNINGLKYSTELPLKGLSDEDILLKVDEHLNLGHYNWKNGRVSGAVYYYDKNLIKLITEVYGRASYTNPLHIDIFPGICKMEAEIVKITSNLFHGDSDACGTMTTGGTESILMAVKAYRDYAREVHGITRPNMVIPMTAHSAFDKAAQYLGIHVKSIKINPLTTEVDLKAMKAAINSNTIMLAGSAPNFPYGTMDDIAAIATLGKNKGIPVHVDACLGGFVIAFMKTAGYKLPKFDFSLEGVTSISADTHKYGFAPKGSSVILYSSKIYRHYQYTVTTDWPGGVYGSPTVNGSRAGGIIAACWATLMSFGKDGYVEATKSIIDTARYIEKELRKIKGIYIYGKPATSVIAIGSKDFDIFRLSDSLCKLGWNLNPLQFPSGIHICVTYMHTKTGIADKFLNDVGQSVAEIMKSPGEILEGKMAIYGAAQSIPDRTLIGDFTKCFVDSMYYVPPKV